MGRGELRRSLATHPEVSALTVNEEHDMADSAKDKVKGAFHQAKGKLKETAGKLTDNPKLRAKGKLENLAGNAQDKLGKVEKALGD
jgi:uncharacterized protein YjbJ (UPF0337 family)